MYKLHKDVVSNRVNTVQRGNSYIPFAPDNTDYVNFKKDIANGAKLLNADGEVMTTEQIEEFMRSLP